jgi:hypothetical protein
MTDDLDEVTDVRVQGDFVLTAEQMRTQIRWSRLTGHANCSMQPVFYQEPHGGPERLVICVLDLFDERWPTKSVTNDAEYVVDMVVARKGDAPIIYRDTEGNWDELRHRQGHFACFRALRTKDYHEAIKKVLALHDQDEARYADN